MPSWVVLPWFFNPSAQGLRRVPLRLVVRRDGQTPPSGLSGSCCPAWFGKNSWAGRRQGGGLAPGGQYWPVVSPEGLGCLSRVQSERISSVTRISLAPVRGVTAGESSAQGDACTKRKKGQ